MNSISLKIVISVLLALTILSCASSKQEEGISSIKEGAETMERSSERHGPRGQNDRERPTFVDLLSKMDSDKDGKLSNTEVKGPLKEMFPKGDSDGDGYLTEEEFAKMPPPPGGRNRG